MKKRTLARIRVEREKRAQKRAWRHPSRRTKDPKDLRGAKGALLKNATEAILEEGPPGPGTADQRYAPYPGQERLVRMPHASRQDVV